MYTHTQHRRRHTVGATGTIGAVTPSAPPTPSTPSHHQPPPHPTMRITHPPSPSRPPRMILAGALIALWTTAAVAQLSPIHATEEQAVAHITLRLEQERGGAALRLIEPFLEQSPPPLLIDQFTFLHAVALNTSGAALHTIVVLEQFLEEYPTSPLVREARLMLGTLYTKSRRPDRAIPVLSLALAQAPNDATRGQARRHLRLAYEAQGDYRRAIHTAIDHMAQSSKADRRDIRDAVRTVILHDMDEPALDDVLEIFPTSWPGDVALIRRIELHAARGDEALAERDIRTFLQQFPAHPYGQTAAALLRSFIADIKAHRHVIAAAFPLSGDLKAFGMEAFNGVRLALDSAFLGANAIGLVVKDSARPPARFRREMADLLDEFKPIALIGPLLAREVRLVADLPDRATVPFITPTASIPAIAQFGRYWFSAAMTTSLQVTRLVEYAMRQLGYTRFCVLTPNTAYGRRLREAFQRAVMVNGGEIIAMESYWPGTTDAAAQINHLKAIDLTLHGEMTTATSDDASALTFFPVTPDVDMPTWPGVFSLELDTGEPMVPGVFSLDPNTGNSMVPGVFSLDPNTGEPMIPGVFSFDPHTGEPTPSAARSTSDDDGDDDIDDGLSDDDEPLVYVPGFDALFLPGRPPDVAFLSAQLAFMDIPTTLLGTNGWNHPTLLKWGHSTMEGGFFGDALFLHSDEPDVQSFVASYRERFQTDPTIFAAQAYDAARAILATVRQGAATGADVRAQLLTRDDLPTLGGLRRFNDSGILDRKVYMIQIRHGQFVQLN